MDATCPTHLIIPELATVIFVEGYNLGSFSHPLLLSYLFAEKVTYIILLNCFILLTVWSQK
jgi:hypothetical protein